MRFSITPFFTLSLFLLLGNIDLCESGIKIGKVEIIRPSTISDNETTISPAENQDEKMITFKLSDLIKLAGYHPGQILAAGKSGDFSTIRKIRDFVRTKLSAFVSIGCLADMLYVVDSLLEYSMAHYDLANHCVRNKSADCHCTERVQNVIDENAWALNVLDSFGKFPAGFGKGNFWLLGDYEECTEISVVKDRLQHKWEGRYSRIDFFLYKDKWTSEFLGDDHKDDMLPGVAGVEGAQLLVPLPSHRPECNFLLHFKYGACFPKTCSKVDVQSIVQFMVDIPQKMTGRKFICDSDLHYHEELDIRKDFGSFLTLLFILSIATLMIFGTCYDYFVYQNHSPEKEIKYDLAHAGAQNDRDRHLSEYMMKTSEQNMDKQSWFIKTALAFSVYTNAKKVFSMTQSEGHINCLHGIRAISLLWVLFGHTYACGLFYLDNPLDVLELSKNILNQIILNATISVDAFYVLSGMLMVVLWMKGMEKHRDENIFDIKGWLLFYMHRYLRLTPAYALVMVVNIFLVKYLTDGPLWNQNGFEPNQCANSWWTNLLYINNFVGQKEPCMVWTWYLANDMQFYLLSPPLLMILWTSHVAGLAVIILLIFATSILRATIIMTHDYPPISILINDADKIPIIEDFTRYVYVRPYCRCGPFLVGLLLGYVLYRTQLRIRMPKWATIIGWTVAICMGLGVLFGLCDYSKTGQISAFGKFVYAAFGRVFWGLTIAWIIFACSTGYGGIVNRFLSAKFWMPISRLVYCAYLIHPIVMLAFYSSQMKPVHFDGHFQAVFYFIGHVIITFFFAFWLHLAFEVPLQGLEKLSMPTRHATNQHLATVEKSTNQRSPSVKNSTNRRSPFADMSTNRQQRDDEIVLKKFINDKIDVTEQQNSRV